MPGDNRRCILVMGMHRSGTSAITRAINLLGPALPENLIAPSEHNEQGYWESRRLIDLNNAILSDLGRSWSDLRGIDFDQIDGAERARHVTRIVEAVRAEYADAPLFVLKDPRICLLHPLWREAFDRIGIESVPVIVFRHPYEVANSLAKRSGFLFYQGCLLWLRYVVDAERCTRGQERLLLSFEALVQNPREVVGLLAEKLSLDGDQVEAATASINPTLRHNRASYGDIGQDHQIDRWLGVVLRACQGFDASSDQQSAQEGLDRTAEELNETIREFWPFLEESDQRLRHELRKARHARIEAETRHRIDKLRITERSALIGELEGRIRRLRTRKRKQKRLLSRQKKELVSVYESMSWKITRPVRIGAALLARLRGKM